MNIRNLSTDELYSLRKEITDEINSREKKEEADELNERQSYLISIGSDSYGNDLCASVGCRLTCTGCDYD